MPHGRCFPSRTPLALSAVLIGVCAAPSIVTAGDPHGRLAEQIANLQSISFSARVTATVNTPIPGSGITVGEPIEGAFEYRAIGDRWARVSILDEEKYPGMNTVVAFDGSFYSYTSNNAGVVSVSVGSPERTIGMSLPNPILELGRFTAPHNDENIDLLLTRIRAAATTPPAPISVTESAGSTFVTTSGGLTAGVETVLMHEYDAAGLLRRVEQRIAGSDTKLMAIECADHATFLDDAGHASVWPRVVTFVGYDPATGQPAGTIVMEIVDLSLRAADAEAGAFSPNWDAARVWMDDLGNFIR